MVYNWKTVLLPLHTCPKHNSTLNFIQAKGSPFAHLLPASGVTLAVIKEGVPSFSTSLPLLLRVYSSSPAGQLLFMSPSPPGFSEEKKGLGERGTVFSNWCRILLSLEVGSLWTWRTHNVGSFSLVCVTSVGFFMTLLLGPRQCRSSG